MTDRKPDVAELERLARVACNAPDAHVNVEDHVSSLTVVGACRDGRALHRWIDVNISPGGHQPTATEKEQRALHAALLILAGEDKGPTSVMVPFGTPVPPGQTGVVVRCDEPSDDYERAIRDVVAWATWQIENNEELTLGECEVVRLLREAIRSGAAKGAADAERKQGGG